MTTESRRHFDLLAAQSMEIAQSEFLGVPTEADLTLNESDPFDRVLIKMLRMNRKKRLDYAADGDPFSNFRDSAYNLGAENYGPLEAAYQLLLTKVARLRSLRVNGRLNDPQNESVEDTWLDLAVYAVICLALFQEQKEGGNTMAQRGTRIGQ